MPDKITLKVFGADNDRARLAELGTVIETYDAFTLIEASKSNAASIVESFPTEDITNLYRIHAGGDEIDTMKPRFTVAGKTLAHPAFKGVTQLEKGTHIISFSSLAPSNSLG